MENEMIGLLVTLAALWHVVGFAFGFVYVSFSLRSLLGLIPYERPWSRIIRTSDLHLWLSGLALIGLGLIQKGTLEYLSNPKLWSKVTVIIIWFLSTQSMRWIGIPYLKKGNHVPMIQLSALNVSCWIYGAFLGCAKSLSYGVISYTGFFSGFLGLNILIFIGLNYTQRKKC